MISESYREHLRGAVYAGFSKFAASYPCHPAARVLFYAPVFACNAGAFPVSSNALSKSAMLCKLHWSVSRPECFATACAGMMTLFTKALASSTAVSVTAITTAANILLTGAISATVFDATLTRAWFAGLLCVTVGTMLITAASQKPTEYETGKDSRKQD